MIRSFAQAIEVYISKSNKKQIIIKHKLQKNKTSNRKDYKIQHSIFYVQVFF